MREMSKSAISDSEWAGMSEAQRIECVRSGRATLRELVAGLLDGSANLQDACGKSLKQIDVGLLNSGIESKPNIHADESSSDNQSANLDNRKRRHGLPQGYSPRLNRHESI